VCVCVCVCMCVCVSNYLCVCVCVCVLTTSLTAMGTYMLDGITQCYLPSGRGDIPVLTPADAGARFSDPRGMQGWVDLVGGLHTEMVYPPEDDHPSKY